MLLPRFGLVRPETIDGAVTALVELGPDAAVYMGGTELVPLMKLGFVQPSHLVDCKRIPQLSTIDGDDRHLVIGAAVTHHRIERDERVLDLVPLLGSTAHAIGNARVRVMGTLGGNLCFAEPHSDPATLLLALSARVSLTGPTGTRELELGDFILGALETAIEPQEVLGSVTIPVPPPGSDVIYRRYAVRERPTAAVAVVRAGSTVRLVVGAIGGVAQRIEEAEALIADGVDDPAPIVAAVERGVEPVEDGLGGAEFKRHLAGVLTRRALADLRAGRPGR